MKNNAELTKTQEDKNMVRSRLPLFICIGTGIGIMAGLVFGGISNAIVLAGFITVGLMTGLLVGFYDDRRIKQ